MAVGAAEDGNSSMGGHNNEVEFDDGAVAATSDTDLDEPLQKDVVVREEDEAQEH